MNSRIIAGIVMAVVLVLVICGCGKVPMKQYYELNYLPGSLGNRQYDRPYPYTLRIKELDIEEAYNKPQIVYRQSPFELRYYVYRVWAVKPSQMVTDLIYKHILNSNLIASVVKRYDEGSKPDFELTGMIEAIEEYDSDELWFAHIALRITIVRTDDGNMIYNRRFDLRKKVLGHEPELVIREMSALIEYCLTQVVDDIDIKLAKEYGVFKDVKADTGKIPVTVPDSLLTKGQK
jgi:ABC-type uncharacterized transport system auxiliary subunit